MTPALIGFAALILLCFFGIRVGFATMFVGLVGFAYLRGWEPAFSLVGQQIMDDAMNYNLSVIPLFILMGTFIYRADLSRDLYRAAYAGFGRFRGGLALSTVVACAGFSAVCGSSLATAATMTKVAIPPMRHYKYADSLASGSIAAVRHARHHDSAFGAAGDLRHHRRAGHRQAVHRRRAARPLAGALFLGAVKYTVWRNPEYGPAGDPLEPAVKRQALRVVWPVLALFVLVLGGIYGSIFTPTEAAGIGAFGAAVISLTRGHLRTVDEWISTLAEAARTTATLFIVIFGALVFAQFINLSGMPYALLDIVEAMQAVADRPGDRRRRHRDVHGHDLRIDRHPVAAGAGVSCPRSFNPAST